MNILIIFAAKYLIFLLMLVAAVYVFLQEKTKQKDVLMFAAVTLPLAYVFAKGASLLFYNPRPFVVGNFVPLIAHAADNGFPSDHALLASAVSVVIFVYNKKLGGLLFLLALLVGIARVLAGVHHLLDICASFAIAIAVGYVAVCWISPVIKSKTKFGA